MPKKRNEKYWIKGEFRPDIYLKYWREIHIGYHARKAQEFRERNFYSKGLTSQGRKRKAKIPIRQKNTAKAKLDTK